MKPERIGSKREPLDSELEFCMELPACVWDILLTPLRRRCKPRLALRRMDSSEPSLKPSKRRVSLDSTGGLQVRVLLAGACGSTARAIIESPLELAKIRRQTQQTWQFRGLYKGFGVHWCRTMGLMCTYFILIDTQRRHFPQVFNTSVIGPFLVSGTAATLAWWIVWPLEYMKSQVQGNYGKDMPVLTRMRLVIKERGGFLALYRGIGPGTIRSFISNGTSMIVMANAQKKVSEWGLRG
ncbi:mitochondrial arginine transporter BAC2-like isoform X4 [Acanthaster planci]|uniref:Mitochondrial arginine transporter BAC2-like isoform X4 n=1 Tax=Acanthaster planci TaxID=133434 RepID=A0A8B7Y227_ACAPL|nr:mitochondrial arginine transporter BAC2-like isoform X4 [Acanthaster planci]